MPKKASVGAKKSKAIALARQEHMETVLKTRDQNGAFQSMCFGSIVNLKYWEWSTLCNIQRNGSDFSRWD